VVFVVVGNDNANFYETIFLGTIIISYDLFVQNVAQYVIAPEFTCVVE